MDIGTDPRDISLRNGEEQDFIERIRLERKKHFLSNI